MTDIKGMQNKSKILLIDDEVGILDSLSYFLEKEGFEVETATNGQEAFQKILSDDFDGVVSDWMMPEMDGLTLIKKVRAENILIPFIFLSGHAQFKEEQEMVNFGAFKLIQKPDIKGVPETLRQMLAIGNEIVTQDEKAHDEVEFLELINNTK